MASEATEIGDRSAASNASQQRRASSKTGGARSTSNTGASGNTDETAQVAAIRDRLGGAASCSAFISKLWHLMINPQQYSKYIRWDEAGSSIILSSEPDVANEFASDVLPRLFKHGNNASFIRQLNLYGFQRIPSSRLLDAAEMKVAAAKRAELGGSGGGSTLNTAVQLYGAHSSFAHPRFLRGREELLPTMKPRSSKKAQEGGQRRRGRCDTAIARRRHDARWRRDRRGGLCPLRQAHFASHSALIPSDALARLAPPDLIDSTPPTCAWCTVYPRYLHLSFLPVSAFCPFLPRPVYRFCIRVHLLFGSASECQVSVRA
ncbi:hypothetical protein L1887_53820 [Cichorium endivia]|nr:hypothetical protein L1887_53820 [Cichorium endivia]